MKTSFRPLLGFFIFQCVERMAKDHTVLVSVPYWGSLYFNASKAMVRESRIVSVPYWGSLYFNNGS